MNMKKLLHFNFRTRHAGISALLAISALAGLIILNILAGELNAQADLTPRKLYSLTESSLDFIDNLEQPVEIIALFEPGNEPEELMEAVREYERRSPDIRVSVVDPDRNPGVLAKYTQGDEATSRGSFIVDGGERFRIIPAMAMYDISYSPQGRPQTTGFKAEQQISSAIAYVTTGATPKIYEISGHREQPLAALGYGGELSQANYILADLSLTLSDIPEDAALLTLIGPRLDLSPAEADKINSYLESGGALLAALDLSAEAFPVLFGLLEKWDIQVRPGLVMETRPNRLIAEFGDNPFVFAPYLTDHEVLTPLKEGKLNPVFQGSLGFKPTASRRRNLDYRPLLQSSEDSRIRMDLQSESSGSLSPIPGDEGGPIDVAVTVRQRNMDTYTYEGASIAVLGSAATLEGLGYLGQVKANADLLIGLVNWAVGEESIISVPSKSMFRLPLQIGNVTGIVYAGITILLIPLACVAAALIIFYRRRHL